MFGSEENARTRACLESSPPFSFLLTSPGLGIENVVEMGTSLSLCGIRSNLR